MQKQQQPQQQQVVARATSADDSCSRVLIHSAEQTSAHTLPLSITPSSVPIATTRRTSQTQTSQDYQTTKPTPSFAETQLLAVYYPSLDPKHPPSNDKCIFVEQQDRQPVRYRATHDPLSSTRATQTSPTVSPFGSTLIIDRNHTMNSRYDQHSKIQSSSQNSSTVITDKRTSADELSEGSKYSSEEYVVHIDKERSRTPSSSSSSVTTVIAQNGEFDSDHTSNLSSELTNSRPFSTSTPVKQENPRVSSWPPVPDDVVSLNVQYETEQQKRASRVQFAEHFITVIPPSATNSLSDESTTPPATLPRTNVNEKPKPTSVDPQPVREQPQRVDQRPINQSKWIKTQLNSTEVHSSSTSNRVETLRSMFEQQSSRSSDSSTLSSPISQGRRKEPEERPSRHGDEIRFRIKDGNPSTLYHAEPARVVQHTADRPQTSKQTDHFTRPSPLDQIRQITGKQLKSLDDAGHYLQDGHTWQWNEIFWLSLTTSQRDQLKELERHLPSRQPSRDHSFAQNDSELSSLTSTETTRFTTTINITAAGAWQLHNRPNAPSGITKYTETSTLHENQPSVSVFGSAPEPTPSKVGSQESIASSTTQQQMLTSNKRTDSQITIIESGYSSGDDQPRFRPNSSTIAEESSTHQIDSTTRTNTSKPPSKPDPFSYEQFISDYFSTYARHSRSNDGTLILLLDGRQLHLSQVRFSSSKENLAYSEAIDEHLVPFETESDELVIFISGEILVLPADRWRFYREKYAQGQWVRQLKRVNRAIPPQLLPFIEQWLAEHAIVSLDTHELHVDGVTVPFLGRLDSQQIRQLQTNASIEIYQYLLRVGDISYDSDQALVRVAHSELDARRLLASPSPELIERLTILLRSLTLIHLDKDSGSLRITDNFIIPNEYISDLLAEYKRSESFDASELAQLLLQICQLDEDETDQSLVLTFQNQTLRLKNSSNTHIQTLSQWLQQLNQQNSIEITDENDINIYPNHPNQRIAIPHQYVVAYMQSSQRNTITMTDIASILLSYDFVRYSSGQLIFPEQQIVLDTSELAWLQSIIRSIRAMKDTQETEVELFDGQNTQVLRIPYEHLSPTDDPQVVATYLFENGNIRYEVNTGNYAYSYTSPTKEKSLSVDQEVVVSQIASTRLDEISRRNEAPSTQEQLIDTYVEYVNDHNGIQYDNNNRLLMLENPSDGSQLYLTAEHTQFIHQNNYRRQDMKSILSKHGRLKHDEFNNWLLYYNNQCIQIPAEDQGDDSAPPVRMDLSQETSSEVLGRYHSTIDYMYNHGLVTCNKRLKLVRLQCSNQILTIPTDHLRSILNIKIFYSPNDDSLPFTSVQLSQWLLDHASQISNSSPGFLRLTYRNKVYELPQIPADQQTTDPRLQLLFPFNTSLRLLQKTPSTTTLDIQEPNEANGYAMDPSLMLANYVHRDGTIYQDELGRLVIKLGTNEIVIPGTEAASSIEAINATPHRAGTIIARLINRIGKVQSNESGGLIITVNKRSIEISHEAINRVVDYELSSRNPVLKLPTRPSRASPNLPLLQHSKSASSLASSSTTHREFTDDQRMLNTQDNRIAPRRSNLGRRKAAVNRSTSLQPRFIIIPDNDASSTGNRATRFYVQLASEPNSGQATPPQLITPHSYRNASLRDAPVCIRRQGEEVVYENLAQYLMTKQVDLPSRIVRQMLEFSSGEDFFAYLNQHMPATDAKQLMQESEDKPRPASRRARLTDRDRSRSPGHYYNVQHGTTRSESNLYAEQQEERYYFSTASRDPSPTSSSLSSAMLLANILPTPRRSPLTTSTGGQSLTTPDKNVTLPRTLSGQSNDGESESRATVSRSASAAAKVTTSKSDTIKSTTSSSAASSREQPAVSSAVVRAQSLVSPNRTSGSKTGDDSVKKEKKSKFRTPSFLRKRKEKKEAASKDKADK